MASSRQTLPKYIYKIAPSTPAPDMSESVGNESQPILPPSDLDISSNFIHMSTASQVAGTLERFFPVSADGRHAVYLLRLELGPLEKQDGVVRWESPDASVCDPGPREGLFPHLYFNGVDGEEQEHEPVLSQGQVVRIEERAGGWDSKFRAATSPKQGRRLWLRKDEIESRREVVVQAGMEKDWNQALTALQEWLV